MRSVLESHGPFRASRGEMAGESRSRGSSRRCASRNSLNYCLKSRVVRDLRNRAFYSRERSENELETGRRRGIRRRSDLAEIFTSAKPTRSWRTESRCRTIRSRSADNLRARIKKDQFHRLNFFAISPPKMCHSVCSALPERLLLASRASIRESSLAKMCPKAICFRNFSI